VRSLPPGLLIAVLSLAAAAQPRTSFLHDPPAEAPLGKPFVVEGSLVGGNFARVILRVRGPGEPFQDVPLELQYGDLYRVTLPASRMVPPGIEYYFEGVTRDGDRSAIFAAANQPLRVIVIGDDAPDPVVEEQAAPAPKPKCKKGKKCKDEPPPAEPREAKEPSPKKGEWVDTTDKPVERVEKKEPPARAEPRPEPQPARREEATARREERKVETPQTRRQAELAEELALYGAETTAGVAQRIDERERTVPQMPTVLDARQLQQLGVRFVHEALDLVPGLTVSRDVSGFYRVAVRGLRSDPELQFTLNGQPLNNFYDGKALGLLPVDNLERIEIFRGPATVDVGLGNFLGVINLVTRRDAGVRVSGSAGLWEAFDGHANAAGTFGAVTLFGDVDVASQYGVRRPVARDGLDTAAVQRPKSTNDRRFLVNAGLGLSIATEGAGTFDAQGRLLSEDRAALLGLFDAVGPDSRLRWFTVQAQAGWKKTFDDGGFLSVRAWFDQQSTDRLWQLTPDGWQVRASDAATLFPDGVLEQAKAGTRGFGLTARGEFVLPFRNRLVAGASVEQRSLVAYELLANSVPITNVNAGELTRPDGLRLPTEDGKGGRGPAADRLGFGFFVGDTWAPVDVVSVQAGLRFDMTQLPRADSFGTWTGTIFTPSFGPRLGLAVTPVRSLVLRGHYGRSFRAPTVQEYAESIPNNDFNQGRFVGNPQLEGAYVDAVELGAEYVQGVGDGKLRLKANGFFERVSNAIVQVDTSGNLMPHANRLLGVQAVGIEGEARLELTRRLSVWLNASWVRAEDLTAPTQSRILTDVPQVRMNGGVSLPLGRWLNVDVVGRFASERRNNSRSVLELIRRYTLPGNATVTAQLRTEPLFDHVELIVLGQNVFNFEYADDAWRPDRVTSGVPRETWQAFLQAKVGF
jgi:outer membrane receptor protein involved in Fe transport